MKGKEWIKGIAVRSFKDSEYNRCSKCGNIFDPSDNVHTKTDEIDYNLCDCCFEIH